ncbi:3-dehydroquinate dehydratase [Desulfovibrio sp. OttesenSCG-928-F20]|nr:3-dehydroquinate dehydratase [Desulfovibrio sp. OttesenSCG-928-M16]MDL2290616.1 3-dehydroquinate dehydratase [Desulfovibrio sp. OttesenSCG-928-F20]
MTNTKHSDFSLQTADPFAILILNGPNLGHLGQRRPDLYGKEGMEALPGLVRQLMGDKADELRLTFWQGNGEGQILDRLEQARGDGTQGVVLNAGAYTHTSLALADCVEWIGLPIIEVHLSNIFAREKAIRRKSFVGEHTLGLIAGFGLAGYALAVQALYLHLSSPA